MSSWNIRSINARNVVRRGWLYEEDPIIARGLFGLLENQPAGRGALAALLFVATVYGLLGGLFCGLVISNWGEWDRKLSITGSGMIPYLTCGGLAGFGLCWIRYRYGPLLTWGQWREHYVGVVDSRPFVFWSTYFFQVVLAPLITIARWILPALKFFRAVVLFGIALAIAGQVLYFFVSSIAAFFGILEWLEVALVVLGYGCLSIQTESLKAGFLLPLR